MKTKSSLQAARGITSLLLLMAGPLSAHAQEPLTDRERMLLERVAKLEERVKALEDQKTAASIQASPNTASSTSLPSSPAAPASSSSVAAVSQSALPPPESSPSFLGGTTLNFNLDAYYAYNFNDPIGRANLFRTYDVSSNAISLNQVGLILDNQPDVDNGKRWGFRLDLQYGQATATLQGNPANEPRPNVYRNLFQAYGTYVLPVGKGLKVDFGKFASSLGYEGNYTKDQINYSRALWFSALPFYHMGARLSYAFNDHVTANYWLTNGIQQTEPFNGFKDQFLGLTLKPAKNLTWNVNYYLGQEHPNTIYYPNGGAPVDAPTLQGYPFEPIPNAPQGKLHIFDTYASWNASSKWTFVAEADYILQRLYENSSPTHAAGAIFWTEYQLTPKFSLGGRFEYLSDRGALYATPQALKETTLTTKYQFANGFDIFGEWRRDFSNQPAFYTDQLNVLKTEQNTATLGLVWWWGGKQGAW